MGFFWRKKPDVLPREKSTIIGKKVRTMQDDFDEIAKNGHVEMEKQSKKTQSKRLPPSPKEALSSGSPFSQPTYPVSKKPLFKKREASKPSPPLASIENIPHVSLPPVVQNVQKEVIREAPKEPPKEVPQELPQEALKQTLEESAPPPIERFPTPLPISRDFSISEKALPTSSHEELLPSEKQKEMEAKPLGEEVRPLPSEGPKKIEFNKAPIRTGMWPVGQPDAVPFVSNIQSEKSDVKKSLFQTSAGKSSSPPDHIILKEGWGWKHFFVSVIIVGLLGGAGFFFWKTRFPEATFPRFSFSDISFPHIPDITSNPSAEELRVEPEPEPDDGFPFSTKNSNTFLVDVERETVSTLREKLMKQAETMRESQMTGPVPFSVVDRTNTPIAFYMFASVFNLGLSGDLLNALDNDFTLWVFLDGNQPRLSLSVRIKHADNAQKYMSTSEGTLPVSLKNIFLVEDSLKKQDVSFGSGLYRGVLIRYLNFQSESPLSLDYAFIDTQLIIGTSRDSARTTIDTFLDKKN